MTLDANGPRRWVGAKDERKERNDRRRSDLRVGSFCEVSSPVVTMELRRREM